MNSLRSVCVGLLLLCGTLRADTTATGASQLTPSARARVAQIEAKNSVRRKCLKKYGEEIGARTEKLRDQMQEYRSREEDVLKRMYSDDSEMAALALRIDSAKSDENADMGALQDKWRAVQRRIESDADVVTIRDSIASIRLQISQAIDEVLRNDAECRECMGR